MRSFQLNDLELSDINKLSEQPNFPSAQKPINIHAGFSPAGYVSSTGQLESPFIDPSFLSTTQSQQQSRGYNVFKNDPEHNSTTASHVRLVVNGSRSWFWHLEAYRPYFNVTTREVKQRLQQALLIMSSPQRVDQLQYQMDSIRPSTTSFWDTFADSSSGVDLYGPFWISISLLLILAISGNFSSHIQHWSIRRMKLQQSMQPGLLFPPSFEHHPFSSASLLTASGIANTLSYNAVISPLLTYDMQQSKSPPSKSTSFERRLLELDSPGQKLEYLGPLLTRGISIQNRKMLQEGSPDMDDGRPSGYFAADFRLVTSGAIIIFLSLLLSSCTLYCGLSLLGAKYHFLQIVSLIGYSFTPYLIAGVLGCYPLRLLQWSVFIFAGVIASRFVVNNVKFEVFQMTANLPSSGISSSQFVHGAMLIVLTIYLIISSVLKMTFL